VDIIVVVVVAVVAVVGVWYCVVWAVVAILFYDTVHVVGLYKLL